MDVNQKYGEVGLAGENIMCKHGPKKCTKSDLEKALGNALGKF